MIYINIKNKWQIILFFENDLFSLMNESLRHIGCSDSKINNADLVMHSFNEGYTFTNMELKTSIVGISKTTSIPQWYSTLIHELKHVLSHICEYYNVFESSEEAAYLIGYLMKKVISNVK